MEPSYMALHESGELRKRVQTALDMLRDCTVCPRRCRVDRTAGELGFCGTGRKARVASYNLHFGEEEPLVGSGGSGTVFFAQCSLACVFCQNWDISHEGEEATEVAPNQLAWIMLELQRRGAHNVNFVTPSHVVPQILEALPEAVEKGLSLPLVYNSSGYDELETLKLLDGIFDIYMPDAKFASSETAERFCRAPDYPEKAMSAIREMHRQAGDLELDENGVAVSGLLVRHLVMPGDTAGSRQWMEFLAGLSRDTYLNVMDQYRPCGRAHEYPEISRPPSREEYETARRAAIEAGLCRLDRREDRQVWRLFNALRRDD
jgi:putative pyruvate formate lyase activating enzyme